MKLTCTPKSQCIGMFEEGIDKCGTFPRQMLSWREKDDKWAMRCVAWGADRNVTSSDPVRNTVLHKRVNYDLLEGKLHMDDLKRVYNPNDLKASYIPDAIQHYPIMNAKLNVLRGEEAGRVFDFRAMVTDATSVSSREKAKKEALMADLQKLAQEQSMDDSALQARIAELQQFYAYEWQDVREMRANAVLRHYWKELGMPLMFNRGFTDAEAVGEEIYQVRLVCGEPEVRRLDPCSVRVYKSGFSNRIEDADMVVIEEYWPLGKILDSWHDELTEDDMEYLEHIGRYGSTGGTEENEDPRLGFVRGVREDGLTATDLFGQAELTMMPYDSDGNIRVCQVFWKTLRKVLDVKSYDPLTGDEKHDLYPETYVPDKAMGETAKAIWINEAWQGVRIGDKTYVGMGPCPTQFNRLSNPSKCHFGIIGTIYNINGERPYSMVDLMKPYNYYYDITFDRLNKLLARNKGKLIRMDFAKKPSTWNVEQWMSIIEKAGIVVEDSFNEGKRGPAKGKLAGGLNNASSGVVDAELGSSISTYISILEFLKQEMSDIVGISRQREGQISNRETVGGVERATLQSSHITEWLFTMHDDLKKRVLECLLEVAKTGMRGRNMKFDYLLSDESRALVDIDGDEFSESDYGILIDNDYGYQELMRNLPALVQAGLQNGMLTFSAAMKIWNSGSRAEKQRIIENAEKELTERQRVSEQERMKAEQELAERQQETERLKLETKRDISDGENRTRIEVARIEADALVKSRQAWNGGNDNGK